MTNATLTLDEALTVILAHLRAHGRATNSKLRDLIGGDEALFARVHERLIFDDLAYGKGGKGLIYTGPPGEVASPPPPAARGEAPASPPAPASRGEASPLPPASRGEAPATPPPPATNEAGANATAPGVGQRIFLSYGHDQHTPDAIRIKTDLEARGHEVWFDVERLHAGRDWEAYIEDGLRWCDKVVLLMTPYSVRRRDPRDPASADGYCLNELAKALEKNRLVIPVLLVTVPEGAPLSIARVQYLDLTKTVPIEHNVPAYQSRFERLVLAIEQNALDFEGGQARLIKLLRPIDFDDDFRRHGTGFTGRAWLVAKLDLWLAAPSRSRVFWLTAGPGVGKTAFAVSLSRRRDVAAYHLCRDKHAVKGDPQRAVLSIAYQLAQALPGYDRWLQAQPLETDIANTDAASLFDTLVAKPLGGDFPAPDFPRLVVIDAIDEAGDGKGGNLIADLVRDYWDKTPDWLRLVITSRPEANLVQKLRTPDRYSLDAGGAENAADLAAYLRAEIARRRLVAPEGAVDTILGKSEGMFLYLCVVLKELDAGTLSLSDPGAFPDGMEEYYGRWFERQFPDATAYAERQKPLLEVILAQREPMPLPLLGEATGRGERDLRTELGRLGSMFPVTRAGTETVTWFHQGVVDWLTGIDEETGYYKAGDYNLDLTDGERRLTEALWKEHATVGSDGLSAYGVRHLVAHLVAVGRQQEARSVLRVCDFLRKKVGVEGVNALLADCGILEVDRNDEAGVGDGGRATIRQLARAIRQEAHWLGRMGETGVPICFDDVVYNRLLSNTGKEPAELVPGLNPKLGLRHPVDMGEAQQVLVGHQGAVLACAITPDGKHVVSASADHTLRVWDIDSGTELRVLRGHKDSVHACAITPDGKRIVSASSDHTLRVWDPGADTEIHVLRGHEGHVFAFAITPDGRRVVSASGDHTLRVWDLESGTQIRVLPGHRSGVKACAITSDGKRIVSASEDTTLRVWNLESGGEIHVLRGHEGSVEACAITPDGKRVVSTSGDHTLRVWDLESGGEIHVLRGHEGSVEACAITPDGKRIVSAGDHTLRVWDLEFGTKIRCFSGRKVSAFTITLDGRRIVSATAKFLVVYDIEAGTHEPLLRDHEAQVNACAITSDGTRIVSASGDRTLRIWDLEFTREFRSAQRHISAVNALVITPNGRGIVSGSDDGTLRAWDIESGAEISELDCELDGYGAVNACAITSDGKRIVSASNDYLLRVSDLESGNELSVLHGHSASVNACVITPDGKRIVSASADQTLRVWEIESSGAERVFRNNSLSVLCGHKGSVNACVITPDGKRIVSASADQTLRVWDLELGMEVHVLRGHHDWVIACTITPDGKRLVSASRDRTLRVWDPESGTELYVLRGHRDHATACAITPNGKRVVSTSGDHTLRVWDLESGIELHVLRGHRGRVNACAITPDGRRIVSASRDRTLRVWDLHSGTCVHVVTGVSTFSAITVGATALAAGDASGNVWLWRLTPDTVPAMSQSSASSTLDLTGHSPPVPAAALGRVPDDGRVVSARLDDSKLASALHDFYRDICRRSGWKFQYDMDYEWLPDEIKSDTLAAAQRLPTVLAHASLWLVTGPSAGIPVARAQEIIRGRIEFLAEAEHDGWMEHKLRNGWRHGPRDDDARVHDLLISYQRLSERQKDKDRNNVLNYPEIVALAGYGLTDQAQIVGLG